MDGSSVERVVTDDERTPSVLFPETFVPKGVPGPEVPEQSVGAVGLIST